MRIPSKPWLQPPGLDIDPSTRPKNRHETADPPLGHSKVELLVTAEAGLGDRKSCTQRANTSCESVARGYPTPNRQSAEVGVGVNLLILWRRESAETCLVFHINKSLGIVSREVSGHLGLIAVREDCRDQRYVLVCRQGGVDELLPRRRV